MRHRLEPPMDPELRGRIAFHSYPDLETTIQLAPGSEVTLPCGCRHHYGRRSSGFYWTSWPCDNHLELAP